MRSPEQILHGDGMTFHLSRGWSLQKQWMQGVPHKYLTYRKNHYKLLEPAKFQCIIPRIPTSRGHYAGWNETIMASQSQ
ncbi:unnamed protein product [Caretta caretta]